MATSHLLDPGFALTVRPMRYPAFYEMYRDAVRIPGPSKKLILRWT